MNARRALGAGLAIAVMLAGVATLGGCASQKGTGTVWWGDPETGVVLEYRMPEGDSFAYEVMNEQNQTMEVMGQSTDVVIEQTLDFTLLAGASDGESQKLGIAVDSFEISMSTPQGTIAPATDHLAGESFEMALGRKGEESGCEAADGLTYVVPQSGEQSLSSQFCQFFPELPDEPVKVGDTWESTMTIDEGSAGTEILLNMRSMNTLAGFEESSGHECARVETEFTGSIEGSGAQGPATFVMTGSIEGSGVWHFAYKKGILVSDFSMGVSDGEIHVQGEQEMTIPTSREFVMESKLVVPGDRQAEPKKKPSDKKPTQMSEERLKPLEEPGMTPGSGWRGPEPKVATAGGFTVAGVRHRFESMKEATSEAFESIWMEGFEEHHEALKPHSTDGLYFGVSYGAGEGEAFYYLAGMAVPDDVELPEGLHKIDVPEGDYVAFVTGLDDIGAAWQYAFETWLPTSGYTYDWSAPSYEEYPADMTEDSDVRLLLPVLRKE